jgi:predicted O-methyltransferase YrrM
MWSITPNVDYLFALRDQLGPLYGSEDLCTLLYSLVKRERPGTFVELGTGTGVSTVWIAAALKENGVGQLYTFDNGTHFAQPKIRQALAALHGPLSDLRKYSDDDGGYVRLLNAIFEGANVSDRIHLGLRDIDAGLLAQLQGDLDGKQIDTLFADFKHGPNAIYHILGGFLPMMSPSSSIFIDSASTHIPSFLALERLVEFFNRGKVPEILLHGLPAAHAAAVRQVVEVSTFRLMHLVERRDRKQNSTAWIKIEPCDMVPALTTFFH